MMKKKEQRMGIIGGTFDPPHVGHLIIAEAAREQLDLDKVIFVPAFVPPHKQPSRGSTPTERYRMTALATEGNKDFEVSQIELRRKGVSYTIDTLRSIADMYPNAELFLILGSDNYADFKNWKSPQEIISLAALAVYVRHGFEHLSQGPGFPMTQIKGAQLDISSSEIRKMKARGQSIRYLVPERVRKFIDQKGLYVIS